MIVVGVVLGAAVAAAVYERLVRTLRTELNGARANEQLLLSRLASRSLAEYHAVAAPTETLALNGGLSVVDNKRYLYDDTGLIRLEVDVDDEVTA